MKSIMNVLKQVSFLAIISIALLSCSKDNVNDPAQVSVKIEGVSSSVSNGRVSTNLIINQALIGVTKIELEMEDEHHDSSDDHGSRTGSDDNSGDDTDDDSFGEFEIKGNWIVNLLDGTSSPELPAMGIEPGQFNEVKIVMSPIIEDKYSVVFKASYTNDGGEEVPVEIMLSNVIIFKVENDKGLSFSSEKLNELIVQLDLDKWLSQIDLNTLDIEDGKIRISIEHNETEIEKIKINIKNNCISGSDDHKGKDDDD